MSARLALILAVGIVASPAAGTPPAGSGRHAAVELAVSAMGYRDMFSEATFEVTGACVGNDPYVTITDQRCDPLNPGGEEVRGAVSMASLGFHAQRGVESLEEDDPIIQSNQPLTEDHLHIVRVDLRLGGSLSVTMAGLPTEEVDPEPVPGTASPGGEVSGRSVSWSIEEAPSGQHEFSVRFRPRVAEGLIRTFVPQVTIELARQTHTLLDHAGGSVPAAGPVQNTSTLVMDQRVAPAYGEPEVSLGPLSSAASRDVPDAWGITGSLRTLGAYQATASGPVAAEVDLPFSEIAPGAEGVANSAFVGFVQLQPPGVPKGRAVAKFQRDADFRLTGFTMGMRTADAQPMHLGALPAPLGGTLYEGDEQRIAVGGGIGKVTAEREGLPGDSDGAIRPDWGGKWTRGTSDVSASVAPVLEPGAATSVAPQLQPIEGGAETGGAAIPLVVEGGDVDNRSGDAPVAGEPLIFDPPERRDPFLYLIGIFSIPETRFDYHTTWLGERLFFTPMVEPGGYWLESTKDGYDRDWSNFLLVSRVLVEPDEEEQESAAVLEALVLVPQGTEGRLLLIDRERGTQELSVAPGTWRVRASANGFRATAIEPLGHEPAIR